MNRQPLKNRTGFSVIELTVGLVLVGVVLLAFAGVMNVMQRSSATTSQFADAQQASRVALDFITANLRAAGSDVEAYNGQVTIAHAGPYQVVFNGDFDRGRTIQGEAPLGAIAADQSPSTYPSSGTTLYAPTRDYDSGAETIAFTLDSSQDGFVDSGDRGDDAEEDIPNDHLYVLKRYVVGYESGSSNAERESNVSLVRGPEIYPDGSYPPPLFQYYYNHDDDKTTPDKLWGDTSPEDGELNDSEIASMTVVPDSLLHSVRRIKVHVVAESIQPNSKHEDNDGFVQVEMSSSVYIRNVDIREACLVYGVVFYDADGDGVHDSNENGLPKVRVEVAGRKTLTDGKGNYTLPVSAGSFTITETDPSGFNSTTPNDVAVTVEPGQKQQVDFGDGSTYQYGYITGTVYNDLDKNGYKDIGEDGIRGVTIQLNNEMEATTNDFGYYKFTIPVGTYKVIETDLPGYGSTTNNTVSASISSQGDSTTVNFGDTEGDVFGTLRGWVYLDADRDGERDFGETGIADVVISLSSGDQTFTDVSGYYELDLPPAKYDVYELDPPDLTSSTPNLVEDIWVVADSTVTVNFGDMEMAELDFIEVFVGDTERPLSVSAADLGEDNNQDSDIILGTPTTVGPGNIFVFRNEYVTSSTPLDQLFNTTPTYVRNAGSDVNAVVTFDFDKNWRADVVTGLESQVGANMQVWLNTTGLELSNQPDIVWTSGSNANVTAVKLADINRDGYVDMLVAHEGNYGPHTGGFEVLAGYGKGYFYPMQTITTYADGQQLGAVTDLDCADMDGDGDLDIVVASNNGPWWGQLDIYHGDDFGNAFTWHSRYLAKAEVTQVDAVELFDGRGGTDVLLAVRESQAAGGVHVWLNHGGYLGVADTTGFAHDQYTTPHIQDSYINAGGEGLVVRTVNLDGDIFDEIVIGTRSSMFFTGDLFLIRRTADEMRVENIKVNIAGEVVAVDFADFNRDGYTDIVTTTRTSETSGKLAVYFTDLQGDPLVLTN